MAFGKGTWEVANASFVGSNDRGCFGDTEDMAKIGNLVMWMITIVIYIYLLLKNHRSHRTPQTQTAQLPRIL